MTEQRTLAVYIDYKSPYAYLAKDLVYELERDFAVHIDWLPYTLDIPSALGSATVDDNGRVIEEQRNAHQWRRVRYSYMDCRRQAQKRGLVIHGPRKIWDSTLALRGMMYAKRVYLFALLDGWLFLSVCSASLRLPPESRSGSDGGLPNLVWRVANVLTATLEDCERSSPIATERHHASPPK